MLEPKPGYGLFLYLDGRIRSIFTCSYPDGTFIKLTKNDIERFLKLDIDIKGEVMANPRNYYQNKNIDINKEDSMFKVKLDPKVNPLEELQAPKKEFEIIISSINKTNEQDIKINRFKVYGCDVNKRYGPLETGSSNVTLHTKNRQDARDIWICLSSVEYTISLSLYGKDIAYKFGYVTGKNKFDNSVSFYFETSYAFAPDKIAISNGKDSSVIDRQQEGESKNDDCVCGFDANYLQPTFSSGAKTDDIKPAYNLIPLNTLKREAKAWKKGADHYGENNWQKAKGDDKFIKERINHLIEHVFLWLSGDRNEDHLANVRCNAGIVMELTEDASKEK